MKMGFAAVFRTDSHQEVGEVTLGLKVDRSRRARIHSPCVQQVCRSQSNKLQKMLWRVVCLFTTFAVVAVKTEKCATPDSFEGEFVELEDCPYLEELTNKLTLSVDEIRFLRRSYCLDKELVCCQVSNKTVEYEFPERPNVTIQLDFRGDDENLLPTDCGEQAFLGDRIVGQIAGLGEYPWMALLKYQPPFNDAGYACGGALISKKYVLSAAHCMQTHYGPPVEVRLGEYDLQQAKDCFDDFSKDSECADTPQDIPIEKTIMHPNYVRNVPGKPNDIALVRLKYPCKYNDFVTPICLPDLQVHKTYLGSRKKLEVAGWGKYETADASNVLRKAFLPLVDRMQCAQTRTVPIVESQICAGGGKQDSCKGDSGGPLMVRLQKRWYAAGIVSFGPSPCAAPGQPGVYTNVVSYLDWIKSNIEP